jgi:peptidyl-prolyl cis-trans isomerase B (cyclophilin B)
METDQGSMKVVFWYDVAPNTVASFVSLAETGFYDGVTFHRIVPGFVIQGGDPTGTGFGGPGYNVAAEFSDRPHDVGVLSMARTGDPLEGKGISPRSEFANSAGSQFFICLSREKTQSLDRKYTTFGQVVEGLDVVQKIAAVPLADVSAGRPVKAPVITKMQVVPVTSKDDPYETMLKLSVAESRLRATTTVAEPTAGATTQPTAQPTAAPATEPAGVGQ